MELVVRFFLFLFPTAVASLAAEGAASLVAEGAPVFALPRAAFAAAAATLAVAVAAGAAAAGAAAATGAADKEPERRGRSETGGGAAMEGGALFLPVPELSVGRCS